MARPFPGAHALVGAPWVSRALAGGILLHSDTLPGPFSFTSRGLALPETPVSRGQCALPSTPSHGDVAWCPHPRERPCPHPEGHGHLTSALVPSWSQVESASPFQVLVMAPEAR